MAKFEKVSFTDKLAKEQEFFNKEFALSFSGLSKLIYSPELFFRHYVLNQKDDIRSQSMIEGSILHCLLLNPEDFDKQYILSYSGIPSDNIKNLIYRLFELEKELIKEGTIDHTPDLEYFREDIMDYFKEINLYQSLKNDDGRIKKVLTEKIIEYWNYVHLADGKEIVSVEVYDELVQAVDEIKTDPKIMELMGFFADSMNGITKQNEIILMMPKEHTGLSFHLRGIIDNLVFDPEKKEIRINDIKRSHKPLTQIEKTIEYYKYWLQAVIYKKLVTFVYLNQPEYNGWNIVFRFIVVDSFGKAAPIRISDETMKEWEEMAIKELQKADFHFINRTFSLPYEFLINEGELVL